MLGRALPPALAERLFTSDTARLALLRALWPATVGAEIARRTELTAVEGRHLWVRVADATWQRTLVKMQAEVLRRLRRLAGGIAPTGLRLAIGPIAVTPRAKPRSVPRPPTVPLPPPAVVASAEAIADPELRARFLLTAARALEVNRRRSRVAFPPLRTS